MQMEERCTVFLDTEDFDETFVRSHLNDFPGKNIAEKYHAFLQMTCDLETAALHTLNEREYTFFLSCIDQISNMLLNSLSAEEWKVLDKLYDTKGSKKPPKDILKDA